MTKLDAHDFKNDALYLFFNYLNNGEQRVKINSSFSSFQNIISGVPQGYLLGPLLFNIFLIDIFLVFPTEIASYADETHHTQQEIVLKNFAKSRRSLKHSV